MQELGLAVDQSLFSTQSNFSFLFSVLIMYFEPILPAVIILVRIN